MPGKATRLFLPLTIKQQMLEQALAAASAEVCGLLGGISDTVRHYYPVENIAEHPERNYYMSPQGQLDAMKMMAARQEELIGIFHSHPDGPAIPSMTDLELAYYPGTFNFIVSLRDNPPVLHAFRYTGQNFGSITIKETHS